MSDLISRQNAIDALERLCGECDSEWCGDCRINYPDKDAKDVLEQLPPTHFDLPKIYVAEGFDTLEDDDGNSGFGAYVPSENKIYLAADVSKEVFMKTLFHELMHWIQDVTGNGFNEDEAEKFADLLYDKLLSVQPDIPTCGYITPKTGENGDIKTTGGCISRQDAINAILELKTEHRVSWRDAVIDMIDQLPSAQPEPLTDKEQRIFLAAMERERKVCKQADEEWRDCREPYEDSLVSVCNEIERKVKGALWMI